MEHARFGDLVLTDPVAVTHDPADLDHGLWAVVLTFEGALTAVRFATRTTSVEPLPAETTGEWSPPGDWTTSLPEPAYRAAVEEIRERIAAGTVYQVNLCRVDEAALAPFAHLPDLGSRLRRDHPAPYAATIHVPSAGLDVVSASPEGYLSRTGRRVVSRPIKGTAPTVDALLPKDFAENVMITDLVRNDLQTVCEPGTMAVERLCGTEEHPGLVHLVSDVGGTLREGVGWAELLGATFPPGSVSGAPKSSALTAIADLEPTPRGPYCGAIGWVDGDAGRAELAVGIRTFWADGEGAERVLRFGTGAGITWGSDPGAEWRECELKSARLVGLASGRIRS